VKLVVAGAPKLVGTEVAGAKVEGAPKMEGAAPEVAGLKTGGAAGLKGAAPGGARKEVALGGAAAEGGAM
jgi:hypothetical protein